MEYLILGFFTGLSLILAIGAQNIFVIEQGLKKQHIFLVCLVCSISDLFLIFLGISIFYHFQQYFNIFWLRIKFFEKLPKKNTVSEYTCGFKYVKPRVFKKILNFEIYWISLLKLTLELKDLIFE